MGEANIRLGNIDNAKSSFERAIGIDPTDARAAERLGDIYAKYGDFDNAVKYYSMALGYNNRDRNLRRKYLRALARIRRMKAKADLLQIGQRGNKRKHLTSGCSRTFRAVDPQTVRRGNELKN